MNIGRQRPLVLDHLRSFEAVARRAGFGAAAQELHVTQSAVSRQIKSLEDELGAPLFTRGTRRVELTQAGQLLLRAITPALGRIDSAVRQIRQLRGRAQVSLSTFPSFASLWLLPRLPTFEKGQPAIDIRISAVDRLVELDDPDHDLVLRQCRPEDAPPGAIRMFGEVCTPVIGASLADAIARGVAPPLRTPEDLVNCTLIEMDDDRPSSDVLGWPFWLQQRNLAQLEPRRWISVNFTHQQVPTAAWPLRGPTGRSRCRARARAPSWRASARGCRRPHGRRARRSGKLDPAGAQVSRPSAISICSVGLRLKPERV